MQVGLFVKKNLVALIMVPMIVGAHYGWYRLQHVDSLVTAEERNKLPITKALKNISISE